MTHQAEKLSASYQGLPAFGQLARLNCHTPRGRKLAAQVLDLHYDACGTRMVLTLCPKELRTSHYTGATAYPGTEKSTIPY